METDTPRIIERKLEHRIEIEDKQQEMALNAWVSCCFKVDRRACTFITQMVILSLVMTFCSVQLILLDGCDSDPYLGLLTLCIGVVIPSPIFKKKTEQ